LKLIKTNLGQLIEQQLTEKNFMEVWDKVAAPSNNVVEAFLHKVRGPGGGYDAFRRSPRSIGSGSETGQVDLHRRQLLHWWDSAMRKLPAGDMNPTLLQHADNFRKAVEPLDIANFYRLKLWVNSKHYLDCTGPKQKRNRPYCYTVIEDAWKDNHGDEFEDSTSLAKMEEDAIETAQAALQALSAAADTLSIGNDSGAPQHSLDAVKNMASDAVGAIKKCVLPLTQQAVEAAAAASDGLMQPVTQQGKEALQDLVKAALLRFHTQFCENNDQDE